MTQYYWNPASPPSSPFRQTGTGWRVLGIIVLAILGCLVIPIATIIALLRNEQPPGCQGGSWHHGR